MTDPRQLLDAYADEDSGGFQYGSVPVDRDDAAPKAFAALRAVLQLHEPFTVTTSRFVPKPIGCDHCSEAPNLVDWPCPTVQAITTALQGEHSE